MHHFLGFGSFGVTFVTVFVYLAIISVVEWQDAVGAPAGNPGAVNLLKAYRDLQAIAARPHPYNSRDNDAVHDFLINRLNTIVKGQSQIRVVDDLVSNATYRAGPALVYHESLNILVSIRGTDPSLDGVLFSAHFDSVSTAAGATDDGMGVATLLQLITYFVENPPRRRVVFNINNGEEDGLNGAHVFLEHPFANKIGTFLNLEGAGSGGRPLLFRSSNARVTRAFKSAPRPHGNTIAADGFKQGLIRSATDYSVYEAFGWRGLDLAFYHPRSQYHTKYDSVANLGGAGSLWRMIEASLATADNLANEGPTNKGDDAVVYFDVLGQTLVVLTLRAAFVINVIFLALGPLLVAALAVFASQQERVFMSRRGWIRFPVTFLLAILASGALGYAYLKFNPFIVYSSKRSVLLSFTSLFFLVLYGGLWFAEWRTPVLSHKHIVLVENYVIWWILLVFDTVLVNVYDIGALYLVNIFHAGALLAVLLGLVEILLLKPGTGGDFVSQDVNSRSIDPHVTVEGYANGEGFTEHTPLLGRRPVFGAETDSGETQKTVLWMLQYLVSIPFPVLLIFQTALFAMHSLDQTLGDGASPATVYGLALVSSSLMVLPLAPFIHKIHGAVVIFVGVVFVIGALSNIFAFPFDSSAPLKVFFKQTVDLDNQTNSVILEGVSKYLRHPIIDEIPSSVNKAWCTDQSIRPLLYSCHWSGHVPNVAGEKYRASPDLSSLVKFTVKRDGSTAVFTIKGRNTRNCRIYFDRPIFYANVRGSAEGLQRGYEMGPEGVRVVKLWSRTWDREFVVDVGLGSSVLPSTKVSGRVACEWAENIDGRIPALEEVITFIPKWSVATKADDGLVEAYHSFEI